METGGTLNASQEIEDARRFRFGENWARFLADVDDDRIMEAEASLKHMLGLQDLRGKTFLDIGCGSGLFSLAARRLGATVVSFDFDPQSVACAHELKRRYVPADGQWRIEQGSVLDHNYMKSLGEFHVVYSWGVLHHTGAMWRGIENAIDRVTRSDGLLFIAIYNDQGWKSDAWWFIKNIYNRLPPWLRSPYAVVVSAATGILVFLKYLVKLQPSKGLAPMLGGRRQRGMSAKYDRIDWVGGFPYEYASFESLESFLVKHGFSITNSRRATSLGCHELVARRAPCAG